MKTFLQSIVMLWPVCECGGEHNHGGVCTILGEWEVKTKRVRCYAKVRVRRVEVLALAHFDSP